LRCKIFNTNFNPTNQRLGNKILRQRLKGHILAQYYPPKLDPVKWLKKSYPHALVIDEKEEYRLEQIELRKQRGKGAPKKRTAEGKHWNPQY
jgi:hypothetical protein